MPHARHMGGFRRRFGGRGGESPIIEETVFVTPSDLDAILLPPTDERELKIPQAGDILPTDPASVRTALDAENANWLSLYDHIIAALTAVKIGTDFSFPFTNDFFAWKTFYEITIRSTPFGWEPMAQLDEWRKKRATWASQLEAKIGTTLPGGLDQAPPRPTPGQGTVPTAGNISGIVVAVGAVVALVIFGPVLARSFSH